MDPNDIKAAIERDIDGATAIVEDPMGSGDHFRALVIADAFDGKSLVQQHLMVEKAVKDYREDGRLHALALKTVTTAQAEKQGIETPKPAPSLLQIRRGPPPPPPSEPPPQG